ncbi:GNAT family N-acetyltransferase [Pseudomonas alkylphenolica]|uniref:GNAT family N-acetyltransferase n=1 Tax=Pseudomonas alkylphenolica TaxID=237609 RepID=UPI0018D852CE|nr:GNAT family N-acetyltransferase [Pseudomonas alkylphenolica]MBH3431034.1 GNAT family N-acetyltransferase [Pseudomonas alkylphenolica]
MPALTHVVAPPEEAIKSQILQMVVDYMTDISAIAITPSNPLYNLYQYGIGFEVHRYLEALGGSGELKVELIIATAPDDPQIVTGFLLYLPVQDDPDACCVAYMAVNDQYRRRGIARAMLAQLAERYATIELACAVKQAPWFEAMGFTISGTRATQVLMNTGEHASEGYVTMLDVAPIYRTLEVQQIHTYLLKQHGKRAMVDAEKQRDRHLDQLQRKAQAFVQERLGERAWQRRGIEIRLV